MAVSVKDVAAHAGVSLGTVSNVLNNPDRVAPATVARVRDAVAALGYVRNDAARQLRGGDSRVIGLIVLDGSNPFFAELARGAEAAAESAGRVVLLGNSDSLVDREAHYLDVFAERRVLGVLVSPVGDITQRLAHLKRQGIPAVLVDRRTGLDDFSSVSVDDVRGGQLAVAHLLATGRRRIAFVGDDRGLQQVVDRLAGARAAVEAVPGAALEVVRVPGLTVRDGRQAGAGIAERDPLDRPDAVFAANDLVAVGVMQALVMQRGLRVPEDIALVGYDDIDFAASAVVPLTSVRQPAELIGRTAVGLLQEEAADPALAPRQVVFEPELVIRESTG